MVYLPSRFRKRIFGFGYMLLVEKRMGKVRGWMRLFVSGEKGTAAMSKLLILPLMISVSNHLKYREY